MIFVIIDVTTVIILAFLAIKYFLTEKKKEYLKLMPSFIFERMELVFCLL